MQGHESFEQKKCTKHAALGAPHGHPGGASVLSHPSNQNLIIAEKKGATGTDRLYEWMDGF